MRIAAIYLASRVVTTAFFLLAAGLSPPGSRFGPGADLATYAVAWDAQHYQRIAAEGYPIDLPLTDAGEVAQNAWAFMPFYPWAAQATGWLLGSWTAGAVALALVAGYLCCLVLRSILKPAIGETASLWAVAFFASAPLAAMFQVAYAEAPFLLLIMLGIRCLQRRRVRLALRHPSRHGVHAAGRAGVRAVPRALRHPSMADPCAGAAWRAGKPCTSWRSARSPRRSDSRGR